MAMQKGSRPLLAIGLLAVAAFVGFAAGWFVLIVLSALLPPFEPEDGDTMREFAPVAIAYLTSAATTVLLVVLGLKRFPRT
jgi:hypothetical protein